MKTQMQNSPKYSVAKLMMAKGIIEDVKVAVAAGDTKKALALMKCLRSDAEITAENEQLHRDAIEKEAAAAPKEKYCTMAQLMAMPKAARKSWMLVDPNDPRLPR